jgi:hypothetical protein
MNKFDWPWTVSKRKAQVITIGWVLAAGFVLWATTTYGAEGSCLMGLITLMAAAPWAARWAYINDRDKKAAAMSRLEVVYHAHEARNPRAEKPANRLYVPQERKH